MKPKKKVNDIFRFIRSLTFRKTGNLLLVYSGLYLSRILHKPVVPGLPHTLSVEPTTRCNLACPECPVGNYSMERPGGEMDLKVFEELIQETAPFLSHLILYFQGEPFLSPHFFQMIQSAKKQGVYVSTSTNGHFLTKKNIDKLLQSGIDRIIISLDGANANSYSKYRKNGDFERVVNGVKDLMKTRERQHLKHPYVIVQCLIFSHNINEKEDVIRLGNELGVDKVRFKTAQFYHLSGTNSMIPDQPESSRYIKNQDGSYELRGRLKNYCNRLWTTAVVTWDGVLVPCCFDNNADHPMGNVYENGLKSTWKSLQFRNFRRTLLKERKNIDICRNCTEGIQN